MINWGTRPMTLGELKKAVDEAIKENGEDMYVYVNYSKTHDPLFGAMSLYRDTDDDIEDTMKYIVLSNHSTETIAYRLANPEDDCCIDKVYFSKSGQENSQITE